MKYILFISILLLASCQKKSVPVSSPCEPYKMCDTMVEWRLPLLQDTFRNQSLSTMGCTLLSGGRLLFSFDDDPEIIRLVDVSTQELIWEWEDYIPGTTGGFSDFEIIEDKYLYLNSSNEHYCIDLNTGQTLWSHKLPFKVGHGHSSHFRFKVYQERRYGGDPAYPDRTVIYEADISDGKWSPIFETKKPEEEDAFDSDLQVPSVYIDGVGDSIMIFQDRRGRRNMLPEHYTTLYAYNKTKQEVLWKRENLAPADVSNVQNPPVIDEAGNRVFFLTRFTVFCFNLETGDPIWKIPLDYAGVVSGNYFLADNKLITKSDQGYLISFDADTGERLSYTKMGGCCTDNVKAVGNRIYMTDITHLYVANLHTGKLTWRYGGWGGFNGQVAVDEENDVIYAVGSYYLYAMKKPPY